MDYSERIIVVQHSFFPESTSVAQLLGDLLGALSVNTEIGVTVLCDQPARSGHRLITPAEHLRPLHIHRTPLPNPGSGLLSARPLRYLTYSCWICAQLLFLPRNATVLCMTTPPLVAFVVAMALQLKRNRMVYYVEDLYPELFHDLGYVRSPWIVRKLTSVGRIVMRRADAIITIGEYMAERIKSVYAVPEGKVNVVHNWSHDTGDLGWPPSTVAGIEERSRFTIVYSGNVGLAHDFSTLPALVRRLADVPGISYRFVGGGEQFLSLAKTFASLGEDRVEFGDYTSRSGVSDTLRDADLLLIAQASKTLGDIVPSKLYTYLAAGRPILFFGPLRSEISAVIRGYDLGFVLSNRFDVDRAVEYVNFLMANPRYMRAVSRRARLLFEDHFTFEHAYAQLRPILVKGHA